VAKLSLATKDAATTTANQMQEEFRRYLIVHLPVDPGGSVSEGNPFPSLTLFGSMKFSCPTYIIKIVRAAKGQQKHAQSEVFSTRAL
jgi:hypothetical protein